MAYVGTGLHALTRIMQTILESAAVWIPVKGNLARTFLIATSASAAAGNAVVMKLSGKYDEELWLLQSFTIA